MPRLGLLDPRWVEERSRQMSSKAQEEVYAPGLAIEESLKNLAERRTDIFGEGDIETQIGKKVFYLKYYGRIKDKETVVKKFVN